MNPHLEEGLYESVTARDVRPFGTKTILRRSLLILKLQFGRKDTGDVPCVRLILHQFLQQLSIHWDQAWDLRRPADIYPARLDMCVGRRR